MEKNARNEKLVLVSKGKVIIKGNRSYIREGKRSEKEEKKVTGRKKLINGRKNETTVNSTVSRRSGDARWRGFTESRSCLQNQSRGYSTGD